MAPRLRGGPEGWLPWLTLLGFGSYVVSWLGRVEFYAALGVSPDMVGVDYPSLLIPAAVLGVFLVLTLVAVTAFLAPLFMPIPRRAARWQMKAGGWIMLLACAAAFVAGAVGVESTEGTVSVLSVPFIFGGFLVSHGLGAWVGRFMRRRAMQGQIQRLRQQAASPEEARAAVFAYLGELRAQRRRQRARRTERARVRREGRPVALVLLLWLAAVLYIALGAYLADAAQRAAQNVINGRRNIFVGADGPANVLLNVHVQAVRVDAIEPQFRPLQKAQLIYLGTNAGAYVLYDRTARQALLIPSGSVALRFDSPPG